MFWKKKKPAPARPDQPASSRHLAIDSLKQAIAAQEKSNPHVRAQITGKDLVSNLLEGLKDDRGVRIETLLGALGSFAGFSTVYAMVKRLEDGSLKLEMPEVAVVELQDGRKFYFGDFLNRRLAEDKLSVFGLSAGAAEQLGATGFLDLQELFARTAKTIGCKDFGVPDLPDTHNSGDLPLNFVQYAFPRYLQVLSRYDLHPDDYHLACAFAVQEVLQMSNGTIDPALAVRIVMECAVPASKLDPQTVLAAA